ncbi:cleavage stimulation factor, 3' pre-RNA, subunit 1 [Blyttiomyces sp. JEL0837]|nr:cleavage stimulation factor, 3' pre-RNA, subunit 1 [Blyttiomyces sp. JEL0837]
MEVESEGVVGADADQMSKEEILPLIISQLKLYGLDTIAKSVAEAVKVEDPIEPSNRLAELCQLGSVFQDGEDAIVGKTVTDNLPDAGKDSEDIGLDFQENTSGSLQAPPYTSWFTTQHRGLARAAAFSSDGRYFATCSSDASLKVLDVSKIHTVHANATEGSVVKPVIRTLYDHQAPANDVCFHPNGTVLASCSDDMSIKLYDIQKPNVKKGFRYLQDTYPVRSISFHPSGDFLLAGTNHECMRLYDIQTFKCFIPSTPSSDDLKGAINQARFAPRGNVFATAGADGTIRLYDTVAGKMINSMPQAHSGASVSCIQFSKNGRYLLSAGQDSVPRVWDVSSGKVVHAFEGVVHRSDGIGVTFTFNDDYILSPDEVTNNIVCWDARTGALLQKYPGCHQNVIRGIASSPSDMGFVTCSDDCRARYWNVDTPPT